MSDGELAVFLAAPEHRAELTAILAEAGQWLLSRGIRQWSSPPPAAHLLDAIDCGEVYLAREAGQTVGTFTLNWDDPVWLDKPAPAGFPECGTVTHNGCSACRFERAIA